RNMDAGNRRMALIQHSAANRRRVGRLRTQRDREQRGPFQHVTYYPNSYSRIAPITFSPPPPFVTGNDLSGYSGGPGTVTGFSRISFCK
ncbi:MAG: hypothetical protein JWO80_4306, partial [Bryobacterales bacterium]|nr:hypothetical protein [Bryobacterales bacterium]